MIKKYVRLLSYNEAIKLIEFVNDYPDYNAHITVGGVGIEADEKGWGLVETYLECQELRFEITEKHPTKVVAEIKRGLREEGLI